MRPRLGRLQLRSSSIAFCPISIPLLLGSRSDRIGWAPKTALFTIPSARCPFLTPTLGPQIN